MDLEIVYLEFNDWFSPEDSKMFIDTLSFLEESPVCINAEVWDQSINYWVTGEKSWLDKNCPEILKYSEGKQEEHLDWKPENYGYHLITEDL